MFRSQTFLCFLHALFFITTLLAPKISEAQKFLQEGTVGAEHWLSVNQSRFEESFPTPETLHQSFDGIPFKELPIVHIKATKNNTLINAVTFEVSNCRYGDKLLPSTRLL